MCHLRLGLILLCHQTWAHGQRYKEDGMAKMELVPYFASFTFVIAGLTATRSLEVDELTVGG